jgi:hypothetical protein
VIRGQIRLISTCEDEDSAIIVVFSDFSALFSVAAMQADEQQRERLVRLHVRFDIFEWANLQVVIPIKV